MYDFDIRTLTHLNYSGDLPAKGDASDFCIKLFCNSFKEINKKYIHLKK